MPEVIKDRKDNTLAIIIRGDERIPSGVVFLNNPKDNLQLAGISLEEDEQINSHYHNPIERNTVGTAEVLVIKSGKVLIGIYGDNQEAVMIPILRGGDLILLLRGGHSLTMLEDTEMYEIKQGPYTGIENDKTYF